MDGASERRSAEAGQLRSRDDGQLKPLEASQLKPQEASQLKPQEASQLKPQEASQLKPLDDGERPRALLVAVVVASALAAAVAFGVFTINDLSRHGGSRPAGVFIAAVLLALALGMYRRRYWAVLGFEALLAFQVIVTSLALVVAETWLAASLCALDIGLAGWLFWKLVRVMGRIQATERIAPAVEAAQGTSVALGQAARGGAGTDEALR